MLERELNSQTPAKKPKSSLRNNKVSVDYEGVENVMFEMDGMGMGMGMGTGNEERPLPKTPRTRQRKLTTRKWDLGVEGGRS